MLSTTVDKNLFFIGCLALKDVLSLGVSRQQATSMDQNFGQGSNFGFDLKLLLPCWIMLDLTT